MARRVKKDPKMFAPAPDVKQIIREVVHKCYPDLTAATIHAIYGTEPQKKDGKLVLASTDIIRGRQAWLSNGLVEAGQDEPDPYFLIEVFKGSWDRLNDEQKAALIDHQLAFCEVTPKGLLKRRDYDVKEFTAVIHRRGFWRSGIDALYQAAKKHDPQAKLALEEKPAAETEPKAKPATSKKPPLKAVSGGASQSAAQ